MQNLHRDASLTCVSMLQRPPLKHFCNRQREDVAGRFLFQGVASHPWWRAPYCWLSMEKNLREGGKEEAEGVRMRERERGEGGGGRDEMLAHLQEIDTIACNNVHLLSFLPFFFFPPPPPISLSARCGTWKVGKPTSNEKKKRQTSNFRQTHNSETQWTSLKCTNWC